MSAPPTTSHSMTRTSPAELPARAAARAIDACVVAATAGGLGQVMGFGYDWLLVAAAVVLGYFAGFDAALGATPGKLALGIRVVGARGGTPSLREALLRESFTVLGAVPFAGPLLALGAWAWIVLSIRASPLRQGKHDTLAGTRAIQVRGRRSPSAEGAATEHRRH